MGLIPSYLKYVISTLKNVEVKHRKVVTLGNQDIWADYKQIQMFCRELNYPYVNLEPSEIQKTTSHMFLSSKTTQGRSTRDFINARTFFKVLGIKNYADIDLFGLDQASIIHDLSVPIPSELKNEFDLVIDGGTIEHIFDIRMAMKNIVSLLRLGGKVIHFSPADLINHGFYNLSPCFFFDYYLENGFSDFECYLVRVDPQDFFKPAEWYAIRPEDEHQFPSGGSGKLSIIVFQATRKEKVDKITVPIVQGRYKKYDRFITPTPETMMAEARKSKYESLMSVTPKPMHFLIRRLYRIRRKLKYKHSLGKPDFIM